MRFVDALDASYLQPGIIPHADDVMRTGFASTVFPLELSPRRAPCTLFVKGSQQASIDDVFIVNSTPIRKREESNQH